SLLGSVLDLQPKPKSLEAYQDCIVPAGGSRPFWTPVARGGGGGPATLQPVVTFVVAGKLAAKTAANARGGADELDVNFDPHTGVIASAFWLHSGRALGPVTTVPARGRGFVFLTRGSTSPTPLIPPAGATGIHVVWDQ